MSQRGGGITEKVLLKKGGGTRSLMFSPLLFILFVLTFTLSKSVQFDLNGTNQCLSVLGRLEYKLFELGGTETLVGPHRKFEPASWDQLHATVVASSDCSITLSRPCRVSAIQQDWMSSLETSRQSSPTVERG